MQAVRPEGDGAAAENVDTETDYLERRAADLREVCRCLYLKMKRQTTVVQDEFPSEVVQCFQ